MKKTKGEVTINNINGNMFYYQKYENSKKRSKSTYKQEYINYLYNKKDNIIDNENVLCLKNY